MVRGERREREVGKGERNNFEFENSNGCYSKQGHQESTEDHWFHVGKNNKGKRSISKVVSNKSGFLNNRQGGIINKTNQVSYTDVVYQGSHKGKIQTNGYREHLLDYTTIFLLNLPQRGTAKEIWSYLGKNSDIKDIILPKKMDVNGNRIGFIKIQSRRQAENLIYDLDKSIFLGHRIHLKFTLLKKQMPRKVIREERPYEKRWYEEQHNEI